MISKTIVFTNTNWTFNRPDFSINFFLIPLCRLLGKEKV
jgi:hypothetical protein